MIYPFVSQKLIDIGYENICRGSSGNTQVLLAAELEYHGGGCPICLSHFVESHADTQYGKFTYFQPGCKCFRHCEQVWHSWRDETGKVVSGRRPGCGRYLITERLLNIDYCTNCQSHEAQDEFNGRIKRNSETDQSEQSRRAQ